MNDTVRLDLDHRSEVADFVARVRDRLSDLPREECEELVGGLEGDLAELVSDGGSVRELGDPRAYADELRAAAGLAARRSPSTRPPRRGAGEAVGDLLDRAHGGWEQLVAVTPLDAVWSFLVTLRPVWWFLRAWLAVQLLDLYLDASPATLVPDLGQAPMVGLVLTGLAVVLSVQIGRGRYWPGTSLARRPGRRVLLLALNVFAALVVAPMVASHFASSTASVEVGEPRSPAGLMNRGAFVENVFPYDAQGRPLTGVQLFDQDGRPLRVNPGGAFTWDGSGEGGKAVYPWLSAPAGRAAFNVFPLPERRQDTPDVDAGSWQSGRPPRLPQPPLVAAPGASLPGSAADPATAQPTGTPTAEPSGTPAHDSQKRGVR